MHVFQREGQEIRCRYQQICLHSNEYRVWLIWCLHIEKKAIVYNPGKDGSGK